MSNQIYSAKYSNVDVYEFLHSTGSVMKRKKDGWVNATHILKTANFAKAKRTRILEKEVIQETHEKVQGGFGKYQGTWVPLSVAISLAQKFEVYDELKVLFDFEQAAGETPPPPAPKHHHASKAKALRAKSLNDLPAKTTTLNQPPIELDTNVKIQKKRGRPASTTPKVVAKPKRKLTAKAKREAQSNDALLVKPHIPSSTINTNQLPYISNNGKSLSIDEMPSNTELSVEPDNIIQHQLIQDHQQFKEIDLNDGLSSDVEQPSYLPTNKPFEHDVNHYHAEEKGDTTRNRQYSMDNDHTFLQNSPNASTPTLPSSPSDLNDAAPFDNRYSVGTSPVISTIPRYTNHKATENITTDINDEVNTYLSRLVDYFTSTDMKSNTEISVELLNPPKNSAPYIDVPIDPEIHTAFHWACSMGNLPIVEALYNVGTSIRSVNSQGQTPLMRSVMFYNCYSRRSFPKIFELLHETVFDIDNSGQTILHHIVKRKSSTPSAMYYLDLVLSKVKDYSPQYKIEELLNCKDSNGNTALHIAAKNADTLFYKTLVDNGALKSILNNENLSSEDIINSQGQDVRTISQLRNLKDNELFESFVSLQASIKNKNGQFKSKSSKSISENLPKVINLFKTLAEKYDESYGKSEDVVESLQQNIFNVSKSIKNVNVKTAEILKISNINEIPEVLVKNMKKLEQLKIDKEVIQNKLKYQYRTEKSKLFNDIIKEVKKDNDEGKLDKIHDRDEILASHKEAKEEGEILIRKIINKIQDNSKIHKYRKMISEGTAIDLVEVDNNLDTILTSLTSENMNEA
ncbi:hypothetical protein TPHA_0B00880 [Tetrapisispora phaffii CBS 4417]|uniref:Transcription factor MBP1 n=1 Tax=Tetrapisispora phaffii (strain ATCC 24235 / CBS 4417 / NBRC 1672 / NRRL Y-8282 / UCD 70-5) TaxID=1071381 RepID=G8BQG3_TETPH|nr:hypothetical protein TPHA_0B00880 [Tetrapisispora phaffii CBS 4417]CCE61760.1 hypothetical protein TPHA_0B00880 [Tetrapisispora phaffii CBS 4417]